MAEPTSSSGSAPKLPKAATSPAADASKKAEDPFTLPLLSPKSSAVLFAPTKKATSSTDISHQRDKSKKTTVPPTKIPEQYWVKEDSATPSFDGSDGASYDEKTRMWRTTVFPSLQPSSRQEVLLLEQWLNTMLLENQKKQLGPIEAVKEAQELYAICFHEILRQVYVTCSERGQLLEKIWTRYLQLFDHVLKIRDRERAQYNQKLQQQKLMYQQLYKDKDEAFNQVYLQLAAEKEKTQMSKDKLERAVLVMQEDIKKRAKREARLKRVISHLRAKAKEINAVDEEQEEGYNSDESLLPPDLSSDTFGANNAVIVQKLKFIEDKLCGVKKAVPQEQWDSNYGSLLELDSLLRTLSDTISRLTTSEETPAIRQLAALQMSGRAGPAMDQIAPRHNPSKFAIEKSAQYSSGDLPVTIPKPFVNLFSKTFKLPAIRSFDKQFAMSHINAIYAHKIVTDEECDAKNLPKTPLIPFVYNFFITLYGVRQVAEANLLDFLETIKGHADKNLRISMFGQFMGVVQPAPGQPVYNEDDTQLFLYTLAHFHEGPESEIGYQETPDGCQWIQIETVRLVVEMLLRDQDAEVRSLIEGDCEDVSLQGRVELDLFLQALLARCHPLCQEPEEQLTGLFNAGLGGEGSAGGAGSTLIFDDYSGLMKGFNSAITDLQMHQMYRDVLDELSEIQIQQMPGTPQKTQREPFKLGLTQEAPAPVPPVLQAITTVARRHGLLGWRTFPPTTVDRKRCSEFVFNLLSALWSLSSTDLQREVAGLIQTSASNPELASKSVQMIQERQEDLQRVLEARDNPKLGMAAWRLFNEQLFFLRKRELKSVQGKPGTVK